MCGISGYISKTKFDDDALSTILNHRGPDSKGRYTCFYNGNNIALFHNRLSIIDLSDHGHQPMINLSKDIIITFNGEIYNYQELKKNYLNEYSFSSNTDTEVVLYLFEKFGTGSFKLLKGDFAFAIYNKKDQKIFIVRDRFGVKPLYYYYNNSTFFFSSEVKSFITANLELKLNENSVSKFFVFKYVPQDDTLFSEIKRLTPSHYLIFDLNTETVKIEKYWSLSKKREYEKLNYNDAVNLINQYLARSIKSQLMGDVPIGNFFSGGLDSSVIAYHIRNNHNIRHYTAKKDRADLLKEGSGSDYDNALKLSRSFNLDLVPVDIGRNELNTELIDSIIYYGDDLIADGSQIPSYLITKSAAAHSKVMLSGMGADEIFLGYAGHQLSLLSSYLDIFPDFFTRNFTRFLSGLNAGKGKLKPFKRYLKKVGNYHNRGSSRYGFFNIVGDVENSLSVYPVNIETSLSVFNYYFDNDDDPFDNIFKFEFDNFLVKNLHYFDRMCMANSVEGRVPFLDYEFVELVYSLPRKYKLSALGYSKKILKDSMRGKLPDYIINRRKAGFGMPLRSIFSSKKNIDALLDINFFNEINGFSVAGIQNVIRRHLEGTDDNSALIFSLITFHHWYKKNILNENAITI